MQLLSNAVECALSSPLARGRSFNCAEEAHGVAMPRVDSDVKLDFKDVLVRPKRSTLKSRSEVSEDSKVCLLSLQHDPATHVHSAGRPPPTVQVPPLEARLQWHSHHCLQYGHRRHL